MSELFLRKGPPTCEPSQVTTKEAGEASSGRNSVNNAWYVNTSNGNRNNNNTYNRNNVVGASEFIKDASEWIAAEAAAYKNRHDNFPAARLHYHLPELFAFVHEIYSHGYRPRPMSAFILTYPVFREAFAPHALDCVVDHYCAPLFTAVAEGLHNANGNISHGNRIGRSAHEMAEKVREDLAVIGPGYRAHIDIRGFFLNIDRRKAAEMVERYAPTYYDGEDRDEKLALLKDALLNDPIEGVTLKSPRSAWENIPASKSLFNAPRGKGLPIGKYPSQVVAGIYLTPLDARLREIPGLRVQHFVDDYDLMAADLETIRKAISVAEETLSELGLQLHPHKRCVQPTHRGMLSCGRVVKGQRIYISNRTVYSCRRRIAQAERSEAGAVALARSINSVFGLLCHCNAFNIQKEMATEILADFHEWLYFRRRPNHLVCTVKKRYTQQRKSRDELLQIITGYERLYKSNPRSR